MAKVSNVKTGIESRPAKDGAEGAVAQSAQTVAVTDSTGRVIELKKPAPLMHLDFKKALGNNHQNVLYLAEVMPLAYVAFIDGDRVPTPQTEIEIRALYQRLGEEGNAAVQQGVAENFFSEKKDEEKSKS